MPSSFEIEVRAFREQDIESFRRTLDAVARERAYLVLLEAPALEEMRVHLSGQLAGGNPHFVAEMDGDIVGWCDIRRHHFPSHAHRGSLGMGILQPYRGTGLGQRLLEAALFDARRKGFQRIELGVRTDNHRAIRLYRRLGFKEEGVAVKAVRVDGEYYDTLNMALLLM